jgi:hypothetical protein
MPHGILRLWNMSLQVTESTAFVRAISFTSYTKTKLRGLSPQENYTDRETAACQRSQYQLLRIEGAYVVIATNPYGRILGFLDRSRCFFFQVPPQLYSRG